MRTRIVQSLEWHSFFRDFSRIHSGAMISMSISDPGIGFEHEVMNQPLRGISEDGDEIFIHVGNGGSHMHIDHRVQHVDLIEVQQTDEGADAEVDITSSDGTRTMIRFRSPS